MLPNFANHWFRLQEARPFADSMLWDLQRRYFAERGREAWRHSEVPHYVTCNPSMANCYAEIVFALLQDSRNDSDEALHICELGAGSGRFAFHFLQRLAHLCEYGSVPLSSFKYILSDYAASNLDAWHKHPRFQPFFASGVLDMAHFDVNASDQLTLRMAGTSITRASLQRPLVVLANYLFDSVPQDLYYVKDGQMQQCLVALEVDYDPRELDTAETLARLRCSYSYQPLPEPALPEPEFQVLLGDYRDRLQDSHLLFPTTGLRCLRRLKALSKTGMLLLTADKGEHQLETLEHVPPPEPERHGSFSLQVNFHAFTEWCAANGGLPLKPESGTSHVGVCGLLMAEDPQRWHATRLAFRRQVQDFSPDDFYTVSLHARNTMPYLSLMDMLAYQRLAHYDAHLFGLFGPRLMDLSRELAPAERVALIDMVQQVWENYFPLGEEMDLAEHIGYMLYMLAEYALALTFYERSTALYGVKTTTLFNRALCQRMLGHTEAARALATEVLQLEPENDSAREFLEECRPEDVIDK